MKLEVSYKKYSFLKATIIDSFLFEEGKMKRFWLVLLSLGLIMAFSASAFAVDVKVSGEYYAAGLYLNKTNVNGDTIPAVGTKVLKVITRYTRQCFHGLLFSETAHRNRLHRISVPEADHALRCLGKNLGRSEKRRDNCSYRFSRHPRGK